MKHYGVEDVTGTWVLCGARSNDLTRDFGEVTCEKCNEILNTPMELIQ